MATSVAPEGREAPADPGAAAREASAAAVGAPDPGSSIKIAGTALPGGTSAPRGGESGDEYKERVRVEARARAMALAGDRGMPGVGAPELSDADKAAALADINRRAEDPAAALMADAAARAAEAAVVDPAAPVVDPVVDPAADPAAPVVDPAAAPVVGEPVAAGIPVEIRVPGQDTPFVLEVGDQDTADIIGDLTRRATRGDQAREIRAEAARQRDDTDDFRFTVDLDPAGVIQEAVTDVRDYAHLAKFMLSRPGVLADPEIRKFVEEALDDTPERAKERGELMELERLKRRDAVRDQVDQRRSSRQETRAIASTIHESIESLVPDEFSNDGRELLYNLTIDAVDGARRRSPGGKFDRRNVPGIIQHHLKTLGIAPRGTAKEPVPPRSSAPAPVVPKPAAPPAVAVQAKTATQLRDAARARQDAATASPGRGSEVSRIPTPPAFDPAQPGDAIQQRVRWARSTLVHSMAKRPVGS